jgi:hypothetical protein
MHENLPNSITACSKWAIMNVVILFLFSWIFHPDHHLKLGLELWIISIQIPTHIDEMCVWLSNARLYLN